MNMTDRFRQNCRGWKKDIDKIVQALYNDRYIEIDDIRRREISVDEEERRFGVRY